jgi:HEAT repeat protein
MGKVKPQDIEKLVKKKSLDKLVKMLNTDDNETLKLVIHGIGELKDPKGAPPICEKFAVKYLYHIFPDIVEALVKMGPDVADIVKKSTEGKTDEAIRAAIKYYAQCITEKTIGYLLELKKSPNEKIARSVEDILKEQDKAITEFYVKQLDGADIQKKKDAAAYILEKEGVAWKKSLDETMQTKIFNAFDAQEWLKSDKELFRDVAVEKIAKGGLAAVPELVPILGHSDPSIVDKVKTILSKFGGNANKTLLGLLPNQTDGIKKIIIQIIGKTKDAKLLPDLVAMLQEPNSEILAEIVAAIGQIGDKQALDHVALLYNHPDAKVRENVAITLGIFKDARALGALLHLANNPVPEVQVAALKAVGNVKDPVALPYLFPLIQNDNPNVAAATIEALGKIGGPQADQAISVAIKSPQIVVRRAAVTALGAIGGPSSIQPLIEVLNDNENIIVSTAAMALGRMQAVQAVVPLCNLLKGDNDSTRRVASKALQQIGAPAVETLAELLREQNATVREMTLEALAEIGDPRIYDWLVYLLNDPVEAVREAAAKTLQDFEREGKIQPLTPEIQSKIQQILVKQINA